MEQANKQTNKILRHSQEYGNKLGLVIQLELKLLQRLWNKDPNFKAILVYGMI